MYYSAGAPMNLPADFWNIVVSLKRFSIGEA